MDLSKELIASIEASNEAMIAKFRNIEDRLETFEARRNRPHLAYKSAEDFSTAAMEHKSAFEKYLRYGEATELRELQAKALGTTSGPDGGFAVPKVIDGMLENVAVNISPIRAISQVVQTSSQDFHKLVNIRGTSASWVAETAARPATNTPQLEDVAPPMGELYANLQATQVMLDDAFFNAEQWLSENAGTEFGRAEGVAFISGTGVNQPRGFLNNPAAATADATRAFGTLEYVATGSAGAFKTVSGTVNPVDDLYALVGKMKAQYRSEAVWVMAKSTLFQVAAMKDYQGRYVFNPATAPGMQDTILGFPVYEAEDMPAIASNSFSIAFGNFRRGYLIADRIGTRVIRDPFSNKPYVGFYITKRLGACVLNSECIKLLKFGTS